MSADDSLRYFSTVSSEIRPLFRVDCCDGLIYEELFFFPPFSHFHRSWSLHDVKFILLFVDMGLVFYAVPFMAFHILGGSGWSIAYRLYRSFANLSSRI